jgi:repressor LexA
MAPKVTTLYAMAAYLKVNPLWLMGYDEDKNTTAKEKPYLNAANLFPVTLKKLPLLGNIAAGEPIWAQEGFEAFVAAGENTDADFCLKVKGDSMINAGIFNGDIVLIKSCPDVNDGEIAAVLIDDEATLKRVYKLGDRVILRPENPAYEEMVYQNRELDKVKIIGLAVSFHSRVRHHR